MGDADHNRNKPFLPGAKRDRLKVVLLWPGGLFSGGANFGVPQLLSIAGVLQQSADVDVEVIDLDLEAAFGAIDLNALIDPRADIIGISCYSSYDYLKVMAIAGIIRLRAPKAWLVVGGYHPSARPGDFTRPGSPINFVAVGDGEGAMLRLCNARLAGKRPLMRVVGPEPFPDHNEVRYDWSLLSRYVPVAHRVASQAEIYLSRGCPFDCAFCMERAKRDVSWRPFEPLRAVDEMHRLDRFLDLSNWTLFVADALFGMKKAWRREFLEELARRPIRSRKTWLLIRVDLIEREDIELMARANISPGFGLESGDPEHLKRIRKTGKLQDYLEKMIRVSEWARDLNVPFGANVIAGHPGETERSMRTSAAYLKRLFLDQKRGTTGFLSVDPFRLYPGSPIDEEREKWEADTGMRVHRYPWWEDGDQDFLAEWVDPSADLSFRRCFELQRELFDPIVCQIRDRYIYDGPARDYYLGAIDEQIEMTKPRHTLRKLGLWHLWNGLTGRPDVGPRSVTDDVDLRTVAIAARTEVVDKLLPQPGLAVAEALKIVPRERFVETEFAYDSARDVPLPLTEDGGSTISAMHAYAMAFEALQLRRGDRVADLGAGTGYGAALASEIVGTEGSVVAIEYVSDLVKKAQAQLAGYAQCTVKQGDAHDVEQWRGASKIYIAFAVSEVPQDWLSAIPEGGRMVLPVGPPHRQAFRCFYRLDGEIRGSEGTPVVYVPDRSAQRASAVTRDKPEHGRAPGDQDSR